MGCTLLAIKFSSCCFDPELLPTNLFRLVYAHSIPINRGRAKRLRIRGLMSCQRRDDNQSPPNHSGVLLAFAEVARANSSVDFMRPQSPSKVAPGPFQRRSSTESKTGASIRKVARVRNSRASSHPLINVAASDR